MLSTAKGPRKKNRTLSVVQFSDLEKSKMNSSIDSLDTLIKQVKRSWKVSTEEDPNPLEIALPLLDNTSVGMAYKLPDFLKLTERISQSLQVAVNEHYQAFNNSVGSYDTICHSINESQQTVKQVKTTLKQISSDLSSKNVVLTDLNERSKQYGDMIEILDVIEEFKKLPIQIENLFSDKKFGLIEELLTQADSQAEKYKLWRIPALNNIKNYLSTARKNLFDILLEELNSTIYLKSKSSSLLSLTLNRDNSNFNSFDDLSNLELYINNIVNIDVLEKSSIIEHKMNEFLDKFDRRVGIKVNHHQTEFENDPYKYIHYLLNTLSKLNQLPKALELLAQRHPLELHKIVNDTADEVKLKHPNHSSIKNLNNSGKQKNGNKKLINGKNSNNNKHDPDSDVMKKEKRDIVGFGLGIGDLNNIVLQDFFWQIFTKFLLILQSHRVVFEIGRKLSDLPEEQFLSNLNSYNFLEIWKNMSSEARSLIYSYITNDIVVFSDSKNSNDNSSSKNSNTPLAHITEHWNLNNLFDTSNKKKQNPIRSNTLFQFDEEEFGENVDEETGGKSLNSLHSQELTDFLKEVFPGFKINETLSNVLVNDTGSPYLANEELAQQETLVPGNVFNMRVILEAFLIFVQGSRAVFPKNLSSSSIDVNEPVIFFNGFMKKTFLPQLDETLEYMYNNTVNIDSFEVVSISNFDIPGLSIIGSINGPESTHDLRVFKSGLDFYNLFTRVCEVLNTSNKFREEYTSLVVQLLVKFYNKYEDLYTTLLPNTEQQSSTSSSNSRSNKQLNAWLKSPELSHISLQIVNSKGRSERKLLSTETGMLINGNSSLMKSIDKTQLLHPKNFDSLTSLLGTVNWILSWLPDMRKITETIHNNKNLDPTNTENLKSGWELIESSSTTLSNIKKVQVAFEIDTMLLTQFDGVLQDFEKLFSNALLAIRYDIRLRLIYAITATINNNSWNPNSDLNAICPEVKELCNLIQLYKTKLSTSLKPEITEKILFGIPNLIDKAFITGSEMITVLNTNGIKKLYLNIITIQQSLRTIMSLPEDVDFTHSLAYFDLFKKGVEKIIEQNKLKKSLFNLQENKNMIRLIFSQDLKSLENENGPPLIINKRYHEALKELERVHN